MDGATTPPRPGGAVTDLRWTTHGVERLRERLNADPPDVADLLTGRVPFALYAPDGGPHSFLIDVPDVARFVVQPLGRPGAWIVVTVLDWRPEFRGNRTHGRGIQRPGRPRAEPPEPD